MIGPALGVRAFGSALFGIGDDGDPISNLGFETGSDGIAARWQFDNFTASQFIPAEFSTGGVLEDFEIGWENANYGRVFAASMLVAGIVDSFEIAWENTGFLSKTFGAIAAPLTPITTGAAPPPAESFSFGWSENELFKFTFSTAAHAYELTDDGLGVTDFGDSAITSFGVGALVSPSLGATRALAFDGFEFVKHPQTYSADSSTDQITTTAHGLSVGQRVVFDAAPDGSVLPTPIASGVDYYVKVVVDANNFTIAATSGGTAIDITANGSGPLTWRAPYEYWVTPGVTL